jgi:hypothetical protein
MAVRPFNEYFNRRKSTHKFTHIISCIFFCVAIKINKKTVGKIWAYIIYIGVLCFMLFCATMSIIYTHFIASNLIQTCRIWEVRDTKQICSIGQTTMCTTYANLVVNLTNNGHSEWVLNAVCSQGKYDPASCYNLYCRDCIFWIQLQSSGQWIISPDIKDRKIWYYTGLFTSMGLVLCCVVSILFLTKLLYIEWKKKMVSYKFVPASD